MAVFGAFGAGFLARPFGSIFFGHLGDKIGRHYAMNIAIILMAIPTIAMAFLPDYNTIGIYAPILLILIRVFQGISAGGQFGNLMTLTAEDKTLKYRGFSLSVAYSTAVIGFLLASGISYLVLTLTPASWEYFIWRVPFALGFILLIGHLFLKQDDKAPINTVPRDKTPIQLLLKHYTKHLFLIIVLSSTAMVLYYLDVVYMVTYMETELGLTLSQALAINTISIIFMCLTMPVFGFLSDIIGRKKFHIFAYLILLITAIPLVLLMQNPFIYVVAANVILMAIITALIQAASTPYYTEIFSPQVRATGCSIGFGFGASISGFAPLLATYIMGITSATLGLCILMVTTGVIGLVIAIIIPNQQVEVRRINSFN
ncbi:MAG: MHS family proline/betaine transporter-like MFS transporter [Francisellaceae bacterium]|jgi:MHS family proline/betaine transporter-like MFS transporter